MKSSQEFRELLHRFTEGSADEADSARMSQLLRGNDELQQEYLDWMATQAAIHWEYRASVAGDRDTKTGSPDSAWAQPSVGASRTRYQARVIRWLAGLAAVLLVGYFFAQWRNPAFASPSDMLRASIKTHGKPIEREYLVDVVWNDPETAASIVKKEIRVTTWRDQFWIGIKAFRQIAVGSESDGTIWIALSRFRGMKIEEDELGQGLKNIRDLYGLKLETMLTGLLEDHDLEYVSKDEFTTLIAATPMTNRGWIRQVTIEIDRETKVIRKLVAERRSALRGSSTVTFTLAETRPPNEVMFELDGHLIENAIVLTAPTEETQLDRRREVLESNLGPMTRFWMTGE